MSLRQCWLQWQLHLKLVKVGKGEGGESEREKGGRERKREREREGGDILAALMQASSAMASVRAGRAKRTGAPRPVREVTREATKALTKVVT